MPGALVALAERLQGLCLGRGLTVATADPFDVYALDELQTLTGLHVQPVLASPREITRLIKTHFGVGGETVNAMMAERAEIELLEEIEADDSEIAKQAQEASVVGTVMDESKSVLPGVTDGKN